MRILQVNKFHFGKGGADQYYLSLSRLLSRKGHTVAHFAMAHPRNEPMLAGDLVSYLDFEYKKQTLLRHPWKSAKVPARMIWSIEAARKLERLLTVFKPDIAHVQDFCHHLSPSIFPVLKKHNIPVVMTVHNWYLVSCNYNRFHNGHICSHTLGSNYWRAVPHTCVKDSFVASTVEALAHYLHRWLKVYERYIDLFIFPSEYALRDFQKAGFNMKRYAVVPNFVNFDETMPHFNRGDYVLYAGRLSREKGVDILLEANHILKRKNKKIKIKVVGEGPEEAELKQLAARHQTDVEFLGYKNHDEVMNQMQESAFVVFPTRALESCPLVILEAMALGKPVIASRIGGVPELVQEHKTGLLCAPGDAQDLAAKIETLWNNPALIDTFGREANRQAQVRYHPDQHYRLLLKLYQETIAR